MNRPTMTRRNALFVMAATAVPAVAADAASSARKAAEDWLALVDAGRYGESWESAAAFFKQRVKREQWEAAASQARGPLGALESRSFLAQQAATSLPGAPDGEYLVIQYRAEFANKKGAVETVTPMKDSDGVWRVSGYYVR